LRAGAWAVGIAGDLFPAELFNDSQQRLENRLRQALAQLVEQRQAAPAPKPSLT
jgi:2-dehydro-3-deoxyphosphogluconate aldolase/(4S)-4-hydroxy-2-oxoglutarate aldolase